MGNPRTGRPYRRVREQVLAEDDTCWICGKEGADTIDHLLPISKGGSLLDKNNLKPAHFSCNSARGNGNRRMPQSREW
jgi:5-methylcytosine-specific restriction endonuclease McrA